MSFDLQFVARRGKSQPTTSAIDHWLKTKEHFNGENPAQATYENPVTGVYFSLHRTGESLELNINFCRPTFFALECFEVLANLAKSLDLAVVDPQDDGEPKPYDMWRLVMSWKKSNVWACAALRQAGSAQHYMEEAKATDMWRYQREYSRLKKQYDEAFVPQVIVVQHKGKLLRTAHLTKPCNYLVPPVDCFFLQTNGVVPAEVVMKFLKPHLSEVEGDEWLMEVSESTCMDIMDEWDANYESWKPAFKINEVERVAMDGFVDVKP
jgi:hypothetical protein